MDRAEFSRNILSIGGTYKDVNRLDDEGFRSAWDAHRDSWESGFMPEIKTNADFAAFCYDAGRDFVWDNMGDLFKLSHPERAEEQRKINRWNYIMRNIGNISLCLSDYAANGEETSAITWTDVSTAEKVLADLRDVCEFADIYVKEV
jgi:hypothetical protein